MTDSLICSSGNFSAGGRRHRHRHRRVLLFGAVTWILSRKVGTLLVFVGQVSCKIALSGAQQEKKFWGVMDVTAENSVETDKAVAVEVMRRRYRDY